MKRYFLPVLLVISGCAIQDKSERGDDITADMRFVAGAEFRMGTDTTELEGIRLALGLSSTRPLQPETPSQLVSVSDFYLDTVNVTNKQFSLFVEANPQWSKNNVDTAFHNGRYLEHWDDDGPDESSANHPVTFVTWYAAKAYCEWRGKRLPTEAEHEWAAQDGESVSEFPWGDGPVSDSLVNWGGNNIDATVPVGSYPPNPRGLYDMSGNIWQFLDDPWRDTYAHVLSDTIDVSDGSRIRRVVRGGSYGANAANLRIRYRDSHRPFDAREMVGFRCAYSP